MALMKSGEVPKDAVELTELEATKYVWELITDWESKEDTYALRYGPIVLGSLNALSGILVNRHFRHKLKLGTYGYFSSVIPISVMPALFTALFHRHLVATEMLLMKHDGCPLCYEIRANAIQLGFGIGYPLMMAPITALLFANRYSTFRVPQLMEGPRVMLKFIRKIVRPFHGTLAVLAFAGFASSSIVTYYEMKNNLSIRRKIIEIENKLERKRNNE